MSALIDFKPLQNIILDFDGVICDSAFEAFRIGAATFGLIDCPTSSAIDDRYHCFLKQRSIVGPAWNYYYVFDYMKNNTRSDWIYNSDAELFERRFFLIRKELQERQVDKWLDLHLPYTPIVNCLKKLNVSPTILTNKNEEAVAHILRTYEINTKTIISMSNFPKDTPKYQIINKYLPNANIFIDDHTATVEGMEVNKINQKLEVRLAGWGYSGLETHPLILDMENFEKCICKI